MSTDVSLRISGPASIEDVVAGVRDAFGGETRAIGEEFVVDNGEKGILVARVDYEEVSSEGHVWCVTIDQDDAKSRILLDGPALQAVRPTWSIRADIEGDQIAEWPAAPS